MKELFSTRALLLGGYSPDDSELESEMTSEDLLERPALLPRRSLVYSSLHAEDRSRVRSRVRSIVIRASSASRRRLFSLCLRSSVFARDVATEWDAVSSAFTRVVAFPFPAHVPLRADATRDRYPRLRAAARSAESISCSTVSIQESALETRDTPRGGWRRTRLTTEMGSSDAPVMAVPLEAFAPAERSARVSPWERRLERPLLADIEAVLERISSGEQGFDFSSLVRLPTGAPEGFPFSILLAGAGEEERAFRVA